MNFEKEASQKEIELSARIMSMKAELEHQIFMNWVVKKAKADAYDAIREGRRGK